MTDLRTLGGTYSSAMAINDVGQVVGQSETSSRQTHAFIWQDGVMTELKGIEGFNDVTSAAGINANGDVVGFVSTREGDAKRAVLWSIR